MRNDGVSMLRLSVRFAQRWLCKSVCAGIATARRLRFSSTVVRGFEIARFVAKRDPVASVFDRNPSLHGGGIRNCLWPIRIYRAGAREVAQTAGNQRPLRVIGFLSARPAD